MNEKIKEILNAISNLLNLQYETSEVGIEKREEAIKELRAKSVGLALELTEDDLEAIKSPSLVDNVLSTEGNSPFKALRTIDFLLHIFEFVREDIIMGVAHANYGVVEDLVRLINSPEEESEKISEEIAKKISDLQTTEDENN